MDIGELNWTFADEKSGHWGIKLDIYRKKVDIEKPNWIFIDKKCTLSSKTGQSNKIV